MTTAHRRTVLKIGAATAAAWALPFSARKASAAGAQHGLSVFGELKYPPDFRQFDYVSPNAPKGGKLIFRPPSWAYNQGPNTFDTLNGFVLKGDAPPRIDMIFDSLMVRAFDEPDAVYGLLAETLSISDDQNVYTVTLRKTARFHDGTPLTAADVAFSFDLLKTKAHPNITQTIEALKTVEADGDHTVRLIFDGTQSAKLPPIAMEMPVFSKAFYTENPFDGSSLKPPLGSGAYKVGRFEPGRYLELDRVPDYWGQDLPVNRGHHNFDVIRIEFFRDRQIAFEAFKKGDMNFREEFTSKNWATEYNFPAVEDGRVVKHVFPDDRPSGAQGFFINTRRPHLKDPRVREALDHAFDFEWSNTNLFYGLYKRTQSFFENSVMKAVGPPPDDELALLEPFRGQVPDEVFAEPYVPPTSDGSGRDRTLLRRSQQLFQEAGFKFEDGALRQPDGSEFSIEILAASQAFERIALPYIRNLERLGAKASFRLVDPAQYQLRLKEFDFDLTTRRYALSLTLSEVMRQYWSSKAAATSGSFNLAGIADPAIDSLIETTLKAKTRPEMETAARALDRVLRAGRYWVPQWYKGSHTVAVWDTFGWPEEKPRFRLPVETTWWIDREKADALAAKN